MAIENIVGLFGGTHQSVQAANVSRRTLRGFDVLHLHGIWYPAAAAVTAFARSTGVPYVLSPHGSLDDVPMTHKAGRKNLAAKLWGLRVCREAEAILCCSDFEAEQTARRLDDWGERSTAIRSLPLPVVRPHPNVESGPRNLIAMVGRANPIKRGDVFLAAAKVLEEGLFESEGISARTAWVGALSQPDSIEEVLAALDRPARGTIKTGWLPRSDVGRIFARAAVVVVASDHENFSLVAHEALMAGSALVHSDQVGLCMSLGPSDGVFMVRAPLDFEVVARRCLEGFEWSSSSQRFNRRTIVEDRLDPKVVRDLYMQLYEDVRK